MIVLGELERRINLNRERLTKDEKYKSPLIFDQGGEWPGDWQGRTILALCSHYKIANDDLSKQNIKIQLEDIMRSLMKHLNRHGYFGDILKMNEIDEQQISGNSWFLRGLCEYFELFKDKEVYDLIVKIINNYLIKLIDAYSTYPVIKREKGDVSGHLSSEIVGGWKLSSDVGCAFIMLDGASHALEITKDSNLKLLLEVMIKRFLTIDVVRNNCQTHATLSALRGIFRYYKLYKTQSLLQNIIDTFDIYLKDGMTINYANKNWFGVESWTEPCAVVDSFILAKNLFVETRDSKYLVLLNRIYMNALRSGQRINGGAGCETCLTANNHTLKIHLYEADFCCSMRFAEGLYALKETLSIVDGKDIYISLLNPFSGLKLFDESIEMNLLMDENDTYNLEVKYIKNITFNLYIYVPKNSLIVSEQVHKLNDNLISISNKEGSYQFKVIYTNQIEEIQGVEVLFLGDQLMTHKNEDNEPSVIQDYSIIDEKEAIKIVQTI